MLTLILATTNTHKVKEIQACLAAIDAPIRVEGLPFPLEIEETGLTFMENARIKAEAARAELVHHPALQAALSPKGRGEKVWILAEDSGFVVHALAGADDLAEFPGVRSNRWLTPQRRAELLSPPVLSDAPITDPERCLALWALLDRFLSPDGQTISDLSAHYTCAMVALPLDCFPLPREEVITGEGQMPLLLNAERILRGTHGFGYDPMVFPVVDGQALPQTVAELSSDQKNSLSHRSKALKRLIRNFKG